MSSTPPADNPPFETVSDQSPDSGTVPFWVTACVRMLKPCPPHGSADRAADKVLTVAHLLDADRIKVDGDDASETDRADIAVIAGYAPSRPDAAGWIVSFLRRIGYLRIQKRYEKGTGKRRADRFVVSPRPPLSYLGPQTKDGLLRALRSRAEWSWPDLFSTQNPRATPNPTDVGLGADSIPTDVGVDHQNPRATPNPTDVGTPRARSSSGPSGPSGGGGPEGGATVPAADAAGGTSHENDDTDWARLLARDLPFSQKQGRAITASEARQLAARFRVAAEEYGYSHEQIQQRALDTLAKSDGRGAVTYVLGAFKNGLLDREPVTESLSLPKVPSDSSAASASTTEADTESAQLPPWCGECGDGDERAEICLPLRRVDDGTNTMVPCACTQPGWQNAA